MGAPQPFVLALSCAQADELYPSITALAVRIDQLIDGRPNKVTLTCVARSHLPHGMAAKVQVLERGRWEFLAYAFMPPEPRLTHLDAVKRLQLRFAALPRPSLNPAILALITPRRGRAA